MRKLGLRQINLSIVTGTAEMQSQVCLPPEPEVLITMLTYLLKDKQWSSMTLDFTQPNPSEYR